MTEDTTMPRIILAFEASADQASACLLQAGEGMFQQVHTARHGHAAVITQLGRQVVEEAGIVMSDVTHVAAGCGPGSFTGIRVALATAKGISLAIGVPGIGVSCLAAMAYSAKSSLSTTDDRPILTTADTRRGSFFAQLFTAAGAVESSIFELDPETDAPFPAGCDHAHVVGAGAETIAAAWPDAGLKVEDHPPIDSQQIASLADRMLTDQKFADRLRADSGSAGVSQDPLMPLYVAPVFLGPRKA